jgi:hypothetical protein
LLPNISSIKKRKLVFGPQPPKGKISRKTRKGKEKSSFLAPEKKICIGQGGSGVPKSGGYYYGYSTQY